MVIDCLDDNDNVFACLADTKSSHHISHSCKQAIATDQEQWILPMQVEMDTLKSKHTWDLVKPPPGANIMDLMWVYDDFVGVYLNSLTKEDICMKEPEGFIEPGYEDYVCKLVHMIYGTMQEAHNWYETLNWTYINLRYTSSQADPCVWFKKEKGNYTPMDTYMDNLFRALNNEEEEKRRKEEIEKVWEIKDVGENEYFLGMWVQQNLTLGTIHLLNACTGNWYLIAFISNI